MKKILILLAALAALPVLAQPFFSGEFLNVQSLSISNTAGYTNVAPYLGQSAVWTTNTPGIWYTNSTGVIVTDTNGTTTGFQSVSNGISGIYTNDPSFLTKDVMFHADRNGNNDTNQLLEVAASFNGTSTGAVFFVWAPILKGGGGSVPAPSPFSGSTTPVILDTSNLLTTSVVPARSGFVTTTMPVTWATYAGDKGLRLLYSYMTNTAGQCWVWDISMNGYYP